MEHLYKEEFKKLKVDHDELEAHVRRPQRDEHFAHTINEHNQGESHPRQTNNTLDDNNNLHAYCHEGRMTRQHPFFDLIMEVDLPLRAPRYEHYTPLTTNQATILEEAFNAKIPIQLPLIPPPRLGLDKTKHCKYHHNHGHNTKDYWSLKDKIKELIQARYLA
ncbi:hypothetical protein JHK84_047804 [Glycine max]|nr:hypothetical protein JHK86_047784 [Glycine max]KAG4943755.1 hypothetical protein JHK85_048401 [Glycine max]KAG5102835.1 hypothetical protein JHK84_047804 [Glycine max]